MITLNAASLARLAYWAASHMKARGNGRILNVSAVTACQPVPQFALYSATKSFVTCSAKQSGFRRISRPPRSV
jgi:short-subunit dehydrogenase